MLRSAMESQLYSFGMLTISVIAAIDRLSSQTLAAQIISGVLVMSLILAYTVTSTESSDVK